MKRRKTTPKVVNLPGHSIILHLPGQADHFLEQRWKKEGGRSWQLLTFEIQKVGPQTAGGSAAKRNWHGEKRKMAGCYTLLKRITRLKV